MKMVATTALVIGASAGGVEALTKILSHLPSNFKPATVIVLHQPVSLSQLAIEIFGPYTHLPLTEAEEKEPLNSGHIYFAPPGYHLLIESDKTFSLSTEDPVHFSRPSIDVLFESAADVFRKNTIGVVLSGANQDGARGLLKIKNLGGRAIVQDPSSSAFPIMPLAALDAVPFAEQIKLDSLGIFLSGL